MRLAISLVTGLALAVAVSAEPLELPWVCLPREGRLEQPRSEDLPLGALPALTQEQFAAGEPGRLDFLRDGVPVALLRVPLPASEGSYHHGWGPEPGPGLREPENVEVRGGFVVARLTPPGKAEDLLLRVRGPEGGPCLLRVSDRPDGKAPSELAVDLALEDWNVIEQGTDSPWSFERGPEGVLYGRLWVRAVDLGPGGVVALEEVPALEVVSGSIDGIYPGPARRDLSGGFHYLFRVAAPGWIHVRVPIPGREALDRRFYLHPDCASSNANCYRFERGVRADWLRVDRRATILAEDAAGARAQEGEWTWFRLQVSLGRAADPDQFALHVPGGEAYPEGLDADAHASNRYRPSRARLRRRQELWFFGRTRDPEGAIELVDRGHPDAPRRALTIPTDQDALAPIRKGFLRARRLHSQRLLTRFPEAPVLRAREAALLHQEGLSGTSQEVTTPGRRPRPEVDIYSAFTGALAIQETLQLEVGPDAGVAEEPRTVPVAELLPPALEELPFDEMRGERSPRVHAMDRVVPADLLYVHFTDFTAMREVVERVDEWGTDLLHFVSARGRDARVKPRYQARLGLAVTELGELLGQQVIGEIGLAAFDPFFREGTDVAVLVEPKVGLAFSAYREGVLATLRSRGGVSRQVRIEGAPGARALESGDGSIRLYWAQVCGYEVFATGPKILRALAGGGCEGRGSMAEDPGYRYMRALEPAGSGEGAFLFLSDGFVRRMLSPAWKVATARRNRCAAHLGALGHRARFDPSWALELAAAARCPGGGRYTVEATSARCSVHGTLAFLTPLSETPVARVSESERQGYARWVEEYERYWRGFMDPIGIRVDTGRDFQVKVHVLPLVRNTVYQGLRQARGAGGPVAIPTLKARLPDALASLSLPTAPLLMPLLRRPGDAAEDLRGALGVIDGPATLYAHDAEMLFLLRGLGRFLGEGMVRRGGSMPLVAAVLSLNMPLSMELPIKAPDRVRLLLRDQLGRVSRWSPQGRGMFSYGYDGYQMDGVSVYAFDLGPLRFHTFFAVEGDRLLAATKPDLMLRMIAAVREGSGLPAVSPDGAEMRLELYPGAARRAASMLRMGWTADMRRACFRNLGDLTGLALAAGDGELPSLEELEAALGYRPVCGSGGAYRYQPARQEALCSVHGAPGDARQSLALPNQGGLARLRELAGLGVGLNLGADSLESRILWKRGP